jgi:hypothetical protein
MLCGINAPEALDSTLPRLYLPEARDTVSSWLLGSHYSQPDSGLDRLF